MKKSNLTPNQSLLVCKFSTLSYALRGMKDAGINPEGGKDYFPIDPRFRVTIGDLVNVAEICLSAPDLLVLEICGAKSIVEIYDLSEEVLERVCGFIKMQIAEYLLESK